MEERIQKLFSGLCSRRTAEAYIAAGRVTVNGQPAVPGQRADPDRDEVLLDGRPLPRRDAPVYVLLNKPRGVVTTLSDERGRRTVADLVRDCGARVYPVGRLDRDSEGLLLLTNDGPLARFLSHPSTETEKTYEATVSGPPEALAQAADRLRALRELDGESIHPARVEVLRPPDRTGEALDSRHVGNGKSGKGGGTRRDTGNGKSGGNGGAKDGTGQDGQTGKPGRMRLSVTIHQGKNRQVRRMCARCGLEVLRLRRVREHTLELGKLKPGAWRYLTEAEISELRAGLDG